MLKKKMAVALSAAFLMISLCACTPVEPAHTHTFESGWTTSETEHWHKATCEHAEETSERGAHAFGDGDTCSVCGYEREPVIDHTDEGFDLDQCKNLPVVPFSSVRAVQEEGGCTMKMEAPWSDTYRVGFKPQAVSLVEIYDVNGQKTVSATSDFDITLEKGEIVYVNIVPAEGKTTARITVTAKENKSPLPFDLGPAPDPSGFDVEGDPTVDPLEASEIAYTKRKDTLYVYSNAPETLVEETVNKCVTRQDVTNKSVYFTFEHQCRDVGPVYYGYRVTNTGASDMYVTVKNIGWQIAGSGAYLGEKEWIDFYNTRFELPDTSHLNESQRKNMDAFFGFAGNYPVHDFQPTTYRIPAGKYMYVMGGTTVDSFDSINVDGTANQLTKNAIVENGAVLFDVVGEAEGAFYIYNDISKVVPGGEGCDTHLGGYLQPAASCGWDEGYVIDNQATWTFNDLTASQKLPVNYTNYYSDTVGTVRNEAEGAGVEGTPNTYVEGTAAHRQLNKTEWVTHIDVQQHHEAVGTDVTLFHTVDKNGKEIVYGCNYYDCVGKLPNMGNWMKDFIDVFTFVNQGSRDRTVRINITPNGGIPVMLRTMDGKIVMEEGLSPFYAMFHGGSEYGAEFDCACHYEITVPAHSVVQYAVEYNLMANSAGYMRHSVDLI